MLKRTAVLIAGVATLFAVTVVPAAADVQCTAITGTCEVRASSPGSGSSPRPGGGGADGGEATAAVSQCQSDTEGESMADCLAPEALPGEGPQASPEEVAEQAIEDLALPLPGIGLAPPGGRALVGAPVWMWVAESDWAPVSTTATAGSVSVTATATPIRVRWRMGDGTTVTCQGPGTPFTKHTTATSSPDCGHTYTATGPRTVRASVQWSVQWTGGGASGSDALTRTSTETLRVGEAQSLVQ